MKYFVTIIQSFHTLSTSARCYISTLLFFLLFQFITDEGVELCGTLSLNLEPLAKARRDEAREIQAKMLFGDTEIKATAIDVATKQTVKVSVNFLNESNPKYITKL